MPARDPAQYMRERRAAKPILNLRAHLSRAYDLSLEQYERAVERQGGVCFVCGASPKPGQRLQVDHDHETDVVRALLCYGCNSALGIMKEDPERLRRLAVYAEDCIADRAIVQANPHGPAAQKIRSAFKRRRGPIAEPLDKALAVFHRADGAVSTDGSYWRFPR